MRETRDLLRRRMYLVHKRAELITHLEILNADTFSCGHSDSGQFWMAPFGAGATMDSP
jgi:hypothetical protein